MSFKTASLTDEVRAVVEEKGTEKPFSGEYDAFDIPGTYLCRRCGVALYRSQTKFHAGCGWPSFDEEVPGAVIREAERHDDRTEILCARCRAHLGHVFIGEGLTQKNTRHCVNSLSLDFVPTFDVQDTEEAIFAGGCFWGVEHYFKQLPGVLKTEVGYTGGQVSRPTYDRVCAGTTGHYEAIRVVYDPTKVRYQDLVKYFFEIHDPTQANGQGPDIGEQYRSAIFYYDDAQKATAQQCIAALSHLGYAVATHVLPVTVFWPAEQYHQDYYLKTGKQPYCHFYVKRFI